MTARTSAKHVFRLLSLIAPSVLAWLVALSAPHRDELTRAVTQALGPIWVVLAAALVLRAVVVLLARRREPPHVRGEVLARLDVLTASGSALAWLSAFAIMGAVWLGWASLAAIGLLGTGLLHIVVLYSFIALRDGDVARGGSITRRFAVRTLTEGDDVTEELAIAGLPIPIGFRLFMTGRVGPRWATTRHVLDATESGSEIVLESEIGPAVRGEHQAELLEVWLEDTFGLCRSAPMRVAPAQLTVLPRLRPIDKIVPLLDHGLGARLARPASRLPTEGSFRLREYQPGDDVRRIHWVRSLAAGELIVRLPDELPPDRPRVRLVLDTFFPEAFALACDAPSEMLDTMVAVWLGVARSLADRGMRVTLVTAAPQPGPGAGPVVTKRLDLTPRSPSAALLLGAQVTWQSQLQVDQLLTDEATFIVSRGVLTCPPPDPKFRWIVVLPTGLSEPEWTLPSSALTPFPFGHSENRWSHRRRVLRELVGRRQDHVRAMRAMQTSTAPPPPGSFLAWAVASSIRLEALP